MSGEGSSSAGSPPSLPVPSSTASAGPMPSDASTTSTQDASSAASPRLPTSSASSAVSSSPLPPLNVQQVGVGRGGGPGVGAAAGRGGQQPVHPQQQQQRPPTEQLMQPLQPPSSSQQRGQARPPRQVPAATTRQITDARVALEATMSNTLDREFLPRAAGLHAGQQQLERQFADVATAAASTRQVAGEMEALVEGTIQRLKPFGNLENWADVLDQRMLAIEEALRLVRLRDRAGAGADDDGSSWCSCSDCSRRAGRDARDWDPDDAGGEPADAAARSSSAAGPAVAAGAAPGAQAGDNVAAGKAPSSIEEVDPCSVPLPDDDDDGDAGSPAVAGIPVPVPGRQSQPPAGVRARGGPTMERAPNPLQRLRAWLGGG